MPFQRFSRSSARTDTGAKWLSVQGNGSVSVSYSAMKELDLPEAVFLLFDPETHRIAVQPAPKENKDAYPTRLQGRRDNKKGARVISASAFFKFIGVDPNRAVGRYDATVEDNMLIAQLDESAFTSGNPDASAHNVA